MGRLTDEAEVRAAGGVVVRAVGGASEVAVVHRPRYDDWSLPKGKAEPGEGDEDCALREVEEETGLRCRLVRELPAARYVDHRGRPKRVRYWEMAVVEGAGEAFVADDEVDVLRWVSSDEAIALLTYPHDADLVRSALAPPP